MLTGLYPVCFSNYNVFMSTQAIITLMITIVAAILLISELLRPDLVAMLVLVSLVITGVVSSGEVFSGFSGSAVITILGISVISEGLRQTGVTRSIGQVMHRLAGNAEKRLVAVVTSTSALVSMVMNNIAAVGVILPAALTLARRGRFSPSRLLLPLAYGVSLGGMATLLTTANLIFSNALRDAGYKPFGMLDFLPVGGVVMAAGILFLILFGQTLLLQHRESVSRLPQQVHASLFRLYGLQQRLSRYQLLEASPFVGKTLNESGFARKTGLRLLSITQNDQRILAPTPQDMLRAGASLIVTGFPAADLEEYGLIKTEREINSEDITSAGVVLIELLVSPHGDLPGLTFDEARLDERYGINVIGIWRDGKSSEDPIRRLKIKEGDALLVQTSYDRIPRIQEGRDLLLLEDDPDAALRPKKFLTALIITTISLIVAASGLITVPAAVISGAVMMLLFGCLNMDAAYSSVEWKAIFLIAGMWPLSIAIRSTGLADHAIEFTLRMLGEIPLIWIILVISLAALLLTQITGGQVAALIMAPISIATAQSLGISPYGLAMAAALSCSLSFPTPYGHPVNIMVMTPGGYHFKDYLRVGLPLTILSLILIIVGARFVYYIP